jgi:hypothetical protein
VSIGDTYRQRTAPVARSTPTVSEWPSATTTPATDRMSAFTATPLTRVDQRASPVRRSRAMSHPSCVPNTTASPATAGHAPA